MAYKKKRVSEKHYTTISKIAAGQFSLSVFGKLIKNADVEASVSGITHPRGTDENLQVAHVVGYMEQGRCVRLTEPQLIALPAPDGPADSCGWDPEQYVVWKSLPKNWVTLHLRATTETLHNSLKPFAASTAKTSQVALETAGAGCLEDPDAIRLVRSCSKLGDDVPLTTPLGQLFPSPIARNSFCQCVADGVPIDRSKIRCSASNTLQDVVDDITCD
jgi:hypothetical protein